MRAISESINIFMKIQSRIDQSIVDFELVSSKDYGILLSGGIDSAILLYLMLEECKNKKIKPRIQPFTIPKHDGAQLYINGILAYMDAVFDCRLPEKVFVGNPDAPHQFQSATAILEIFSKHPNIEFLYMGTNQNPPDEYKMPGTYPNRVKQQTHPKVILPFIHLNKSHIIDIMYQFDMSELSNLTHTCTEQKIGRCGQCFQCNERSWAFSILDKTDTGTL